MTKPYITDWDERKTMGEHRSGFQDPDCSNIPTYSGMVAKPFFGCKRNFGKISGSLGDPG
jgi:hypothetical protein